MTMQFALLLTFAAGALSVWILMRMSQQVERERTDVIKNKISTLGGRVISIELVNRKDSPFNADFNDPNLVYKFYRVTYDVDHESKQCWGILEMKQRSYGPGGAIQANWIWRDLP